MKLVRHNHRHQQGFTIIELMIALSILSLLLLIGSVLLIQIGKIYSKGVNATNVQTASQTIVSNVGQALQFGGELPADCTPKPSTTDPTTCAASASGSTYAYCIGTTRYSYKLNSKLSASPDPAQNPHDTYHALWRDTMSSNATCNPLNLDTAAVPTDSVTLKDPITGALKGDGRELLPVNARITRFYVQPLVANVSYGIDVWISYGDNDLLDVIGTGNCPAGRSATRSCAGYARCKGGPGQEYCATSQLSTIITRRLP